MNMAQQFFNWLVTGVLGFDKMTQSSYVVAWFLLVVLVVVGCFIVAVVLRFVFIDLFYVNLNRVGYPGRVLIDRRRRRGIAWFGKVVVYVKNEEKDLVRIIPLFAGTKIKISFNNRYPVKLLTPEDRDD